MTLRRNLVVNICAKSASSTGSINVASIPYTAITTNTIHTSAREETSSSGSIVAADSRLSHSSSCLRGSRSAISPANGAPIVAA